MEHLSPTTKILNLSSREDIQVMDKAYYSFIKDVTELDKFVSLIKKGYTLEKDEVLFIGLMSRNKYLTDEEKKTIDLGRANIVARQIVDELSTDKVVRALNKMETAYGSYLDRSGIPLPEQCLIPYFGTNPVSPIKAFADTQRCFVEYLMELENQTGNKGNTYSRLQRIDRQFWTQLQHAFSRKIFLDIDFDIPDRDFGFELTEEFMKRLADNGCESFRVMTRGGFHVLLNRSTLKYNYTNDISYLKDVAGSRYLTKSGEVGPNEGKWEIETNPNEGLPLCGTMQKDHLVRVV